MPGFRRILHPTDFSETARWALRHAAHLAEQYDADLHLLHVAEVTDGYYAREPAYQERLEDRVRALVAGLDAEALRVTHLIDAGEVAAEGILDYAQGHAADLIVLGTHGRRGLRRLFAGSVAEEVVRRAPCPVLIVRKQDPSPEHLVDGVLVPLDLSEASRAALPFAKSLTKHYDGSRLHALHVFEDLDLPPIYGDLENPLMKAFPEIREKVTGELQDWLDAAEGPSVPTTCAVESGPTEATILEYVETHGIDLLVLTAQGRSGLERLLLGSTAERLMRQAPVPVFIVPVREEPEEDD